MTSQAESCMTQYVSIQKVIVGFKSSKCPLSFSAFPCKLLRLQVARLLHSLATYSPIAPAFSVGHFCICSVELLIRIPPLQCDLKREVLFPSLILWLVQVQTGFRKLDWNGLNCCKKPFSLYDSFLESGYALSHFTNLFHVLFIGVLLGGQRSIAYLMSFIQRQLTPS